mgnify:CR=1 FL=1
MRSVLPFVIFLVLGLGSLATSGLLIWRQRAFTERSLAVEGTVVSSTSHRPSDGRSTASPPPPRRLPAAPLARR